MVFRLPLQTLQPTATRALARRPLDVPPQLFSSRHSLPFLRSHCCSNFGLARSACLRPSLLSSLPARVLTRLALISSSSSLSLLPCPSALAFASLSNCRCVLFLPAPLSFDTCEGGGTRTVAVSGFWRRPKNNLIEKCVIPTPRTTIDSCACADNAGCHPLTLTSPSDRFWQATQSLGSGPHASLPSDLGIPGTRQPGGVPKF